MKKIKKHKLFLLLVIFISLFLLKCSSSYIYYRTYDENKLKEKKEKYSNLKDRLFTIKLVISSTDINNSFKIYYSQTDNGYKIKKTNNFFLLSKNNLNKIITDTNGFFYNNNYIGKTIKVMEKENKLILISSIPLDKYLSGVLNAEMGVSFPDEALKAQAIVSRTFILEKLRLNKDFLFKNNTSHQVFKYSNSNYFLKFVNSTDNLVLKNNNKIIKAFFCASNGGITTTPKLVWNSNLVFPYYKIKYDLYSKNIPEWKYEIGKFFLRTLLERNGYQIGGNGIYVTNIFLSNNFNDKRVKSIKIVFSNGKVVEFTGEKFRLLLGSTIIKSTLFDVYKQGDNFIFKGYGYGHGIGFSQLGAKKMAESGYNFKQILNFYFENCTISPFTK